MKEKQKVRNAKGITLVALVVTIIVLIILAGVSINLILGENGIIKKAQIAQLNTRGAEVEEVVLLAANENKIGETTKTRQNVINDLYTKKKLTEEEVEILKTEDVITIGNIEIDFSILGDSLIKSLKIGDYVNYTYNKITEGYSLTTSVSGANTSQSIYQQSDLNWRILNIDEQNKKVDLISSEPIGELIYFGDGLGYANGVYVLNDICAQLYSNTELGVTARSVKIEDLEKHLTEDGINAKKSYKAGDYTGPVKYGEIIIYDEGQRWYPYLWKYEKESGAEIPLDVELNALTQEELNELLKKDGPEQSDAYYTSPTNNGEIRTYSPMIVKQNFYNIDINETNYGKAAELFNATEEYWVASRVRYCNKAINASFSILQVGTNFKCSYMVTTAGNTSRVGKLLRPVVSIDINNIDVEAGKDKDNEWQLINNSINE